MPVTPMFRQHRHTFHVAGAECTSAVQQAALDHGRVAHEPAVLVRQCMHPAERVIPILIVHVAAEYAVKFPRRAPTNWW